MNETVSARATQAVTARAQLGEDFFGGWVPEDVALFEKYKVTTPGTPGFITDFIGMRTATHCVPWAAHLDGGSLTDIPLPDDGIRAEAIEYFALLNTLETSRRSTFAVVELGASYAPWACAAGILARRFGKNSVVMRAVEASTFFHALIMENFLANGLDSSRDAWLSTSAIRAAISDKPGRMFFPVVTSAFDNGGASAPASVDVDYLGRKIEHEEVPVVTLGEVLDGLPIVDLLHCDIQGAEMELLTSQIGLLNKRVINLFVGTHSRKIEGVLLECFAANGWDLVRERPTKFQMRRDVSALTAMTTRDGGQYWVNPRFRAA